MGRALCHVPERPVRWYDVQTDQGVWKVVDPEPVLYPEAVTVAEAHHDPDCLVVKVKFAMPLDEVVPVPDATTEPPHGVVEPE